MPLVTLLHSALRHGDCDARAGDEVPPAWVLAGALQREAQAVEQEWQEGLAWARRRRMLRAVERS